MRFRSFRILFLLIAATSVAQCGFSSEDLPANVVARVGERVYTRTELGEALGTLVLAQDSADAAQQLIQQWVTNEVLLNEALRRGLRSDPAIRLQLSENERSILVTALLEQLFIENRTTITRSDLDSYYNQHRTQLAITEPFVRIRYLVMHSLGSARVTESAIREIVFSSNADSAWALLANRFSIVNTNVKALSDSYYPASQIAASIPGLEGIIVTIQVGSVIEPFEANGNIHVIQLVDRLEPGTIPDAYMIEELVRSRVAIEARKQMLARQVQRLRNEAIAREELEVN